MFKAASLSLVLVTVLLPCMLHVPKADVPGEEVIKVEAFTRLCPDHRGGDREFKGHGPKITASARLSVRNEGTELWVVMYLHAKETKRDWTEAEGKWEQRIYTTPAGHLIDEILSDDASDTSYTDTNHKLDTPAVRGGSLVSKFEIMGDTKGKDVGNCTDDDTYMNVYFNDIRVKIEKAQAPSR